MKGYVPFTLTIEDILKDIEVDKKDFKTEIKKEIEEE